MPTHLISLAVIGSLALSALAACSAPSTGVSPTSTPSSLVAPAAASPPGPVTGAAPISAAANTSASLLQGTRRSGSVQGVNGSAVLREDGSSCSVTPQSVIVLSRDGTPADLQPG